MRIILILALLLLPLFLPSTICSGEPDKKLHHKCLYPSVMVAPENGQGNGSGFIVRSEKIMDGLYYNAVLSCAHNFLCEGDYVVRVPVYNDWSTFDKYYDYHAFPYAVDNEDDIAIVLFISKTKMPTIEFGFDENLYIGNKVFRIGCGLGNVPRIDCGEITGKSETIEALKDTYRFNIYTLPGDSGSAIFHNYKVVGIARALRSTPPSRFGNPGIIYYNVLYGVPIYKLKKWDTSVDKIIAFTYDIEAKMPQIPLYLLQVKKYKSNQKEKVWETQ